MKKKIAAFASGCLLAAFAFAFPVYATTISCPGDQVPKLIMTSVQHVYTDDGDYTVSTVMWTCVDP